MQTERSIYVPYVVVYILNFCLDVQFGHGYWTVIKLAAYCIAA